MWSRFNGTFACWCLMMMIGNAAAAQVDDARAAVYFEEAAELCQREGGRLWGRSLCGPMVFADAETGTIATNEPAPEAPRPRVLGYANAALEWGEVRWSTFVWKMIPAADDRARARLFAHELFHRVQPRLGLYIPTSEATPDHLDTMEGRYWLQLEWRALVRALRSSGVEQRRAIRDALAFRAKRQSLFPGSDESERVVEINEGLAQYTGTVVAAPSSEQARLDAIDQLVQAPEKESFVRTFAYPSGAAYGILLDLWSPGWNRTIKAGDDLAQLLRGAANLEAAADAEAAARRYGGPELRMAEEQREAERQARIAELRRRFVDGPVLVLPRGRNASFITTGVTPIPGAGTIYPSFRVTGEWGSIEAEQVLMSPDGSTLTVPGPVTIEGRTLSGDGWTVSLAQGWGVRPGPRTGDLRVVRATPGGPPVEQHLRITDVRPLVDERPPFPLVESYLALNPADPTNLLASAMSISSEESVVYGSWDGGETWALVDGPQGQVFPGGDPMLTFDGNGRAYFATISPAIGVWRSADGGTTWEGPAAVGDDSRFDDREWLAVRGTPGPAPLPLYAVAKTSSEVEGVAGDVIIGATSADGGRTFTEPAVLPVDSGFLQYAGDLRVRGDDTLVMPYLVNYERLGDGTFRGKIWLRTASGPGLDWSDASFVADYRSYGESGGDRRWKGLGVMAMAIDETRGRFDGTMYMTWAAPVDDRLQILTARSTDSGRSWSEPVRVNDAGFRSNHSSPMIAINGGGVVLVSWSDRRDDPSDRCFRLHVAASFDGGRSFGTNQTVAERPTCPDRARWLNGGETHGIAALPDGGFRLIWSSGDASGLALWTARIAPPAPGAAK